jgi:hypothetical protein
MNRHRTWPSEGLDTFDQHRIDVQPSWGLRATNALGLTENEGARRSVTIHVEAEVKADVNNHPKVTHICRLKPVQ